MGSRTDMILNRDASTAYARVDFDARVQGASAQQLVNVCLEQLVSSLNLVLLAQERGDGSANRWLTKGLAALTALELGVDRDHPMAASLSVFYTAARRAMLDSAVNFDRSAIAEIRDDFFEIRGAFNP